MGADPFGTTHDRSEGHNGTVSVQDLMNRASAGAAADPRVARLRELVQGSPVELHLVGGAVRDYALGHIPKELDLVVDGNAIEFVKGLEPEALTVHDRFLTATVDLGWGAVDFATARRESYEHPGALPIVERASIEEDRKRRDFTINCLKVDLRSLKPMPDQQGWADLDAGLVRILHGSSFTDDPTRLWRLARYMGRLGFDAEAQTRLAAAAAISRGALGTVSPQRIGQELMRSISGAESVDPVRRSLEIGLFSTERKEDEEIVSLMAKLVAEEVDGLSVEELRVVALAGSGARPLGLHWDEIGLRDDLQQVADEASRHEELAATLERADLASDVDRACMRWTLPVVALVALRYPNSGAASWIENYSKFKLPISGDDLLAAGVAQGPGLGLGLEAARRALVDGDAVTAEALLQVAVAAAKGAQS